MSQESDKTDIKSDSLSQLVVSNFRNDRISSERLVEQTGSNLFSITSTVTNEGPDVFRLYALPSDVDLYDIETNRAYVIIIEHMNLDDRISVRSLKLDLDGRKWSVNHALTQHPNFLRQLETAPARLLMEGPPGHPGEATTRFDMDLKKVQVDDDDHALLFFHYRKINGKFGDPRVECPRSGELAPFALTTKHWDPNCPLKMAKFLDNGCQTMVTICDKTNGELEFNLMLEVTEIKTGKYRTPVIVDPKVKNDG